MRIYYSMILYYLNKGIPHSTRFTPGVIRNDGIKYPSFRPWEGSP